MATKKAASSSKAKAPAPACPDCSEKAAAIADIQSENEQLKKGISPAQVAAVAKSQIEAANNAAAEAAERANTLAVEAGRLQSEVDRLGQELQAARACNGNFVA